MRSTFLRSSLMTGAVLLFAAATVLAGEPQGSKGQDTSKGKAVSAKAVAPGQVKRFHVTAQDGNIAPNTLHVKKGESVRITFVSRDGTYGIRFKDFNIKDKVSPEKPAVIEFVPEQAGSFEFRCTRVWGMKHWSTNGTLVVD
jgi:heme/copper-type cytochrome/quinol oxidase subunit 2